jgi:hypothetical protein
VDQTNTLLWSSMIGLGISCMVVWRKGRKRRKKRAHAVNCFSLHFRV